MSHRSLLFACVVGTSLLAAGASRAAEDVKPDAGAVEAPKDAAKADAKAAALADDKAAKDAAAADAPPASDPNEPAPVLLRSAKDQAEGTQNPDDADAQKNLDKSAAELESVRRAEQKAGLLPQAPGLRPRDGIAFGLGPGDPLMRDIESALGVSIDGAPAADPVPAAGAPVSLPELAGISADELRAKYDIPVELNEAVVAYIRFFQTDAREPFQRWLARSTRWLPLMKQILDKDKVPVDLVYLSMIESGFNPYAYSFAKAAGLWQFVVGTSRRYGLTTDFWIDERRDPILSTEAAGRYLGDLKDRYHGDWYLAWAGYNAGEGKIDKAIRLESTVDFWRMMSKGRTLRAETKHYVPKLIAAALIAKHPERFGFHPDYEPVFDFDEVHVDKATSLTAIAKAAGTDVDTIHQLNPALRRFTTPPTGWDVRIPLGSKDQFVEAFDKLAPGERFSFVQHKVERGESLQKIARAYGVNEAAILRTNGLTYRQVRVGSSLMIPMQNTHGLMAGEMLEERGRKSQRRTAHDPSIGRAYTAKPSAAYSKIEEEREKAIAEGRPDPAEEAAARQSKAAREEARQNAVRLASRVKPKEGWYVVQPGDSLWSIASKHGTTVDVLKRVNRISNHHALQIGMQIALREG